MDGMRSRWLDQTDTIKSAIAFARLQSIGHGLEVGRAYSKNLTSILRGDLGDWRDKIDWPDRVFSDPIARTDFYAQQGLDQSLTNFPATAFRESTKIAGLGRGRPRLVRIYAPTVTLRPASWEDEHALERTNEAHDWLLRLETNIRRFVDERMTTACGLAWPKHRLPKGMYDEWRERKRLADRIRRLHSLSADNLQGGQLARDIRFRVSSPRKCSRVLSTPSPDP
jgi:hypothetical protein